MPCITVPASGATVSGLQTVSAVVTLTGTNPGIAKLIFYLDGEYLLTDFQSPYTFTLPTNKWVDGGTSITVEVSMRDGFTSQRSSIALVFNNGVTQPPVNNNNFTPTSGSTPASGQPFVLAATGDGAGGMTQAANVTNLVNSWNPNLFLYLGDVYEKGTSTEFYNWYGTPDTFYGRFRSVTNPIIGNHEYENGVAPGYFDYWDNVPNYYSYDANGWHFIALNSNCGLRKDCAVGQAQYQWLLNDLNTHNSTCTVAYFHHPVYNVGPQGPTTTMNDIWALLVQKGVDIVLAGHDHNYQRWVPLDGNGQPSATGITQFVAGGGGHGIKPFSTTDPRLAAGFDTSPNSLGSLRFELNQYGASFQYVNYLGTVLDSGAIPCNGAPTDSVAPSVPGNLTATASTSTQADLTWTASSDNVGVAGYDVYRNGSFLVSLGVVTSYRDANLTQGAVYSYQVRARDAAGNVSGPSNTASVSMSAFLFSDGFETGTITPSWTTNTNLAIQQQDIFAGLYAARQVSTGSAASYASKTLNTTQSNLYYSLRFKVISKGSNSAYLQRFRTSSNGAIAGVFLSSTNRLSFRNDIAATSNTSGPLVTTGVWHELQTHLSINGASSQIEVWYDGELIPALSVTANLGTSPIGRVHLGDTSTSNVYNIALDEVAVNTSLIEVSDSQPPSVPTGLTAAASAPHIINLNWNAASDNIGVAGYDVYRNGALLTSIGATTSYTDTPVSPSFTYNYQVQARDAAGNFSARSTVASATTPADTTPPTVTLTSPESGATVYGIVTLSANATDNAAIGHVDFLVNNQVVGTVEEPPYAVNWDSTTVPGGSVTIAARAVDIASNVSAESSRTVIVNNSVTPTPTWTPTPANTPTAQPPVSICLPASQDTFIVQDKPQQVHGADVELKVKSDAGFERRLLVGFDLSSIPPTYTVTDAKFRIYETASSAGQTVNVYRLTDSWNEAQMNWNYRDSVNRWLTPGGDFNAASVASFTPNVLNQYREMDITSLAQNWVNGTFGNYGLLLRASGASGEVRFASREALITSQRPELCITYQQAPVVTATPSVTATATVTQTPGGPSATPTATSTNQPPAAMCLAPAQDSFIVQDKPNQNNGTNSELRIKPDSGTERRILIGFDLSPIPPTSTIVSSTLRLYGITTNAGQTISLYRLTNSWVESQVKWNLRTGSSSWTSAGGDYQSTSLASFAPNSANQYRDIDVTSVTQSWFNGTLPNYGLLLRSSGSTGEVRFGSKEAIVASQQPQLCITYQVVPTVTPTFTSTVPVTPSATPTNTLTSTPTNIITDTPNVTATFTATATPSQIVTPSHTPTASLTWTPTTVGSGNTFTFAAAADAYVNEASPSTNYGSATTLRADSSPVVRSYLRFNVQGLSGTVTRATLRVFTNSSSSTGYQVRSVADTSWSEFAVNYSNSPAMGNVTGTSGSFGTGVWTTVDVTSLISGNGLVSFGLTTTTSTAFSLSSREVGANAPQLVIETFNGPTSTPSATLAPTDTLTFTPSPTFGPTATPSHTPTFTFTPTETAIPSETSAPTATFTSTATSPVSSFTFNPVADAYVNEGSPTTNYGTATTLRADATPLVRSYLRFNVQGVTGSVTRVTLRIFTNSSSSAGYEVRNVADNAWSESTINHTNAPAMDGVSATSGAFGTGVWTTVEITPLIAGNGSYNLALTTTSGTAFSLASREAGANAPQLIIETAQ